MCVSIKKECRLALRVLTPHINGYQMAHIIL